MKNPKLHRYCAASMFGYGLIPVVLVAFLAALISLKSMGFFGFLVAGGAVAWCTATSSRFISAAISTHDQQWLIAYPTGLMYTAFVVISIF